MQTHHLPILNPENCPTFTMIKSGIKTVEGRKYSEKYHSYKQGDTLIFHCDGEKLVTRITYIHLYPDVEQYLRAEKLKRALPCVKTYKKAIEVYNTWSTAEDRAELRETYGYGFMGIGVQVVEQERTTKRRNKSNKTNNRNKKV